jgi:peptidoglycan/LPS O-acetylase OafA/YrhL
MALVVSGLLLSLIVSEMLRIKDDNVRLSALPLIMGYALVALGCMLLFLGFLGVRTSFASPLIYLGKISYGLYVFHMLAIDLAWRVLAPQAHSGIANLGVMARMGIRFLSIQSLAIAITICLAMLSYRFLEYPFLALKNRFTFVKSRIS